MSAEHGFGWIPNRANPNALRFAAHPASTIPAAALPPRKFLVCPPSVDQGALGSCTANACAHIVAILELVVGMWVWISRLMVYREARLLLGAQYLTQDSGAMPDDALAVVAGGKAGPESLWPYDVSKFTVKPGADAYAAAKPHSISWHDFDGDGDVVLSLKQAIVAGMPVNVGFTLRADARGGMAIDHVGSDGAYLYDPAQPLTKAGHDVVAVGYDDDLQAVALLNSWGESWGGMLPGQMARGRGIFWVPYSMWKSTDMANRSAVASWR